jgi:hypothetical protein
LIIQCAAAIAVAPGVDIPFDRRHDLSRLLMHRTWTGAIDRTFRASKTPLDQPGCKGATQSLAAPRRHDT